MAASKEKTVQMVETVAETISKVMADVKPVEKNSSNFGLKFKFQGIEDIVNSLHSAFDKHGLHIRPVNIAYTQSDMSTGKGLNTRIVGTISYEITNRHGDKIEAMVLSEGQDPGDKATGKFMSYGYKALLKQLFMIPTNDPDPDSGTVINQQTVHAPATPTQIEFIQKHISTKQLNSVCVWAANTVTRRALTNPTVEALSRSEAEAIIERINKQQQQQKQQAVNTQPLAAGV